MHLEPCHTDFSFILEASPRQQMCASHFPFEVTSLFPNMRHIPDWAEFTLWPSLPYLKSMETILPLSIVSLCFSLCHPLSSFLPNPWVAKRSPPPLSCTMTSNVMKQPRTSSKSITFLLALQFESKGVGGEEIIVRYLCNTTWFCFALGGNRELRTHGLGFLLVYVCLSVFIISI